MNQCTINDNGSDLSRFVHKTEALLSRVSVSKEQIIKIINNFSFNKAHGYDGISVSMFSSHKAHGYDGMSLSMLKICATEIAVPLQIIFMNCINSAIFPDCWKFANVQPIYKKKQPSDEKQLQTHLVVTHLWQNFRKNCL